MKMRFSDKMHDILDLVVEETLRTGYMSAGVDHLMLGLLRDRDNNACRALSGLKVDLDDMKRSLDSEIFLDEPVPSAGTQSVHATREAGEVIKIAATEAYRNGSSIIRTAHFMLAIAIFPESASRRYLKDRGISTESLERLMSEKGMLRDITEHAPIIITDKIAGALGEQLDRLLSSSDLPS